MRSINGRDGKSYRKIKAGINPALNDYHNLKLSRHTGVSCMQSNYLIFNFPNVSTKF